MFYALWKTPWKVVQVYSVDSVNNTFLINDCGYFTWVDMADFSPID